MSTEVVLWEAGGNKLVPIIYDSNIFDIDFSRRGVLD